MKGLVLEGGGAKGSYHIGVYKAILEEGIEIKGISGTSIGALNGAMIVQEDFDLCYKLWHDISYSMIINASDEEVHNILNMNLSREDILATAGKLKELIKDRGFDISPYKHLLDTYIDEEKIRKSSMDFGMVTVNLSEFKPEQLFIEDIPKGKLKEYLLASSYLPFFKMERIEGKLYLDGAFYNNLPFNLLVKKGYEDLILVRTHAPGLIRKIDLGHLNTTIISPSEDIGRSYVYDARNARKNIKLGYYDGLRAFRKLLGRTYYIKSKEEDYFSNYLLSIKKDKIREIGDILHFPVMPENRLLFEYIIPKLATIMDLDKDFDYGDFLIDLLERKALNDGINRFKIYSFDELLGLIKAEKSTESIDINIGPLERIMDKIDLSTIFNKEEIILRIADIIFCK